MTSQEIRRTWAEAAVNYYRPSDDELENIFRNKKHTSLDNLARKYKRFSNLGLVFICLSACWFFTLPFKDDTLRYVVIGAFILYFGSLSILDRWFYYGVSKINCYTMTVKEVVEKALYYKKKHLLSVVCILPFAAAVIGLFAYSLITDPIMIYAMIVGGVVGLIIGSFQLFKFMNEYKNIID